MKHVTTKATDRALQVRKLRAPLIKLTKALPGRVTIDQYSVLQVLNADPVNSQAALCRLTHIDRSTMGDIVKRLEERGYVDRKRDASDKRSYNIKLTKKGKDILQRCLKAEEKFLKANPF